MKVIHHLSLLLAVFGLLACWQKPSVSESEKALFLRARDLVEYGYEFKPIDKYESFAKTKYFDGSCELEYEFQTPESEQDHPLYLSVTVTIERKKSDALLSRGAEKIGLQIGLKRGGIKIQEVKEFKKYGDDSSFSLLTKDGHPVGNILSLRVGPRLYTVLLAGIYIDDPQIWDELILPKLKLLAEYQPS
jgi:hypothetical protein